MKTLIPAYAAVVAGLHFLGGGNAGTYHHESRPRRGLRDIERGSTRGGCLSCDVNRRAFAVGVCHGQAVGERVAHLVVWLAGAVMVERLCKEYEAKRSAMAGCEGEEEEAMAREVDNVVLLLAYLYDLGVVACGLIYDLVRKLLEDMGERDAELLVLLLRHSGPQLRSDDPSALKEIVVMAQVSEGPGGCRC